MLNIFFVPGMFGSTLEYMLRNFTKENDEVIGEIKDDGSMHTFLKEFHPTDMDTLENLRNLKNNSITTPIYPFKGAKLPEILNFYSETNHYSDYTILMHADNLRDAEMNMLFAYHKISIGLNMGLNIFCGDNKHNIVNWNRDAVHWNELEVWQLREWFSIFYSEWVSEWINSQYQIKDYDANALSIKNTDMLFDTEKIFHRITSHFNLTIDGDYHSFIKKWQVAQQYIVDEFDLIDKIVYNTSNNLDFTWNSAKLDIVAESIIQKRLRDSGYEIQCWNLNVFPDNSKQLYNILTAN